MGAQKCEINLPTVRDGHKSRGQAHPMATLLLMLPEAVMLMLKFETPRVFAGIFSAANAVVLNVRFIFIWFSLCILNLRAPYLI